VATPAYLAARRRQIPIVVHDANVKAGLANRIGALFTRHVFTAHPGTKLPYATCIGIPLRKEISGLDRLALADQARVHFGLRPDLPVLLVTGGSQGARSLNLAVLDAAGEIRAAGVQVLHLLGPRSGLDVHLPAAGPPYVTLPYVDRMDLAYAAADFALCRSGALTCAELTTVGLPAAYVPLPGHPARGGHVRGGREAGQPARRRPAGRRGHEHHREPAPGPQPRGARAVS
jgi:UDP-N-acetylglucosamine--N-acetylmuramyl-(pentapeptide) pyrophosphoryl-undecaprenol N-acetylglucosamine transferase